MIEQRESCTGRNSPMSSFPSIVDLTSKLSNLFKSYQKKRSFYTVQGFFLLLHSTNTSKKPITSLNQDVKDKITTGPSSYDVSLNHHFNFDKARKYAQDNLMIIFGNVVYKR